MDFKWAYMSFEGRMNRKPFFEYQFLLYIFIFIIQYILNLLISHVIGENVVNNPTPQSKAISIFPTADLILYFSVYTISIYPHACLSVKRLHDRGKSGLWFLAVIIINIADLILTYIRIYNLTFSDINRQHIPIFSQPLQVLMAASGLFIFFIAIELLFLRGTRGPNKYGPDPLG